ncbi:HEPN domain-containing protein [Aerosticca soli]|uniref:HEPN domain-containing protein n=1 Tax=Aerosticca soli TaxID=2010829 RepID=UPI000F847BE5|nr:HEPN domain-containing protein [Aerosticca soli]
MRQQNKELRVSPLKALMIKRRSVEHCSQPRIAIDGIRLLIPGSNKKRIFTSADHGPPRAIERLRQMAGHDLTAGSGMEIPGVGGAPGAAQELIDASIDFRKAAGNCITVVISPTPAQENLPELSQRWSNAIHWYGRACVSDADFVALPMFGFALDICAVVRKRPELEIWLARSSRKSRKTGVRTDGLTLKAAVRKVYEWRSKIAHGSLLAADLILESERVLSESIANAMLYQYVMCLEQYRSSASPVDTGEYFLEWLRKNPPSTWSPTPTTA